MDANIQNMFEINYSQLIQYEILEKLVTLIISLVLVFWLERIQTQFFIRPVGHAAISRAKTVRVAQFLQQNSNTLD